MIAFASVSPSSITSDLFVYVITTNTMYQVTSTSTIHETLTDISLLPGGDVRVVWNANDGPGGELNIYATTFRIPLTAGYQICLLYDPLVAKRSGSAYPIRLQLCDAAGNNLSSPSITVHAVSVTRTSNNAPGALDDTGNANPDFDFRYDAALAGYVFNLSTKGLSTGTYGLNFTTGSDPSLRAAPFAVK